MPKLIKDRTIIEDSWQLVSDESAEIPDGAVIVPLSVWQARKEELAKRDQLGIWLNSDESPREITESIGQFQLIAINFPAFADGRGFTYGRELREQMKFTGELRAIGSFMRDQLYYLQRCGFNAFSLEGADMEAAITSLKDFSNNYQAAIDEPAPLFRRR
jgi:uncharacterized protein (DUF934 family)